MPGPLGRREPTDFEHVSRWPLTVTTQPLIPVPVVMGVNWYVELDRPYQDRQGIWWAARNGNLTNVRGGHSFCLEAHNMRDSVANWRWFNQVSEGICVSEAWARCMALLNRKRFQPRPFYDVCQQRDEYPDTPPEEGTSVRAGGDVARTVGLWPAEPREDHWYSDTQVDASRQPDPAAGITANRWAKNADDVLAALGTPSRDWVTILNSWGLDYPHRVRLPASVLDRLILESGEAALPTDR